MCVEMGKIIVGLCIIMCTMTWMYQENGYELFFNRDEAKTRQIAYPPQVRVKNGVSFITPVDADAGGTWMGVNALGISVCLLNGFGKSEPSRTDYISRGALVMGLLDVGRQDEVVDRIEKMNLTVYRPFSLIVLTPTQNVRAWTWDGKRVREEENVSSPLVSSSFRLEAVSEHRHRVFGKLNIDKTSVLEDYHRSHVPEAGPFSVCMHRDDAHTVSLSRVVVTEKKVNFHYAPGAPCVTDFLLPVSMPRID